MQWARLWFEAASGYAATPRRDAGLAGLVAAAENLYLPLHDNRYVTTPHRACRMLAPRISLSETQDANIRASMVRRLRQSERSTVRPQSAPTASTIESMVAGANA